MNFRIVARLLGVVCLLMGGTMLFSLPWAWPGLGLRHAPHIAHSGTFEAGGFFALLWSVLVCFVAGGGLYLFGRSGTGRLYRKEAMAVVGLSWVAATLLGGIPYWLAAVQLGPSVRLGADHDQVWQRMESWMGGYTWRAIGPLSDAEWRLVEALLESGGRGMSPEAVDALDGLQARQVFEQLATRDPWGELLLGPGDPGPTDRLAHYRLRFLRMSLVDSWFEAQSGFSTTGATVITDLEDTTVVPHCILFWRSSTHFLGGLGIIVLFVAILGQGSIGKILMVNEVTGPSQEIVQARTQHAAWSFAGIYLGLNVTLSLLLKLAGMSWFDALCHAFGTMATGGFSTYNQSLAFFQSPSIEAIIMVFMLLAGTNFSLLYFLFLRRSPRLLQDVEFRTYLLLVTIACLVVVLTGMYRGDFPSWTSAFRYGSFQVLSIVTTTGFVTQDFDSWNSFSRGLLLALMFVGGCAGSTGGGMKVVRHVLFAKILRLEIENAFRPTVVRPLRLDGKSLPDQSLRHSILVYFAFVFAIFFAAWLFVVAAEPESTWYDNADQKLIDSAGAVAATLNNIGPGLGTVGATENYSHFSWYSKLLFTWLMMVGRVEVFVILCLFVPRFWRAR